jgi:hypothetical protein
MSAAVRRGWRGRPTVLARWVTIRIKRERLEPVRIAPGVVLAADPEAVAFREILDGMHRGIAHAQRNDPGELGAGAPMVPYTTDGIARGTRSICAAWARCHERARIERKKE